jgi:ArsR family transcriptional regulator, arsenate/arsenite/antimonite-responsive transcriptional repressor
MAAGTRRHPLRSSQYVDMSGYMDMTSAIQALSALAQDTRLAAFRLLVAAGAEGLPAGEIARRLDVPHNTLSTHLALLARAGLVTVRRDGRAMIHAADLHGIRALLGFLLEDCCGGRPDLCAPLLDTALAPCCPQGRAA